MVIGIATIIGVSTIVAAIAVLASLVVPVRTIEETGSFSLQVVIDVAVAGTLTQISLLSFVFVWEKYRRWLEVRPPSFSTLETSSEFPPVRTSSQARASEGCAL